MRTKLHVISFLLFETLDKLHPEMHIGCVPNRKFETTNHEIFAILEVFRSFLDHLSTGM